MRIPILALVMSVALSGCWGNYYRARYNTSAHEQVQERFAFERECSEPLVVTEIARNSEGWLSTIGVTGCGHRDVFVFNGGSWMRDSNDADE